jgi:hypothetical protein
MSSTVADFLLDRLGAWGVDRIYGYPGDGINGMTTALRGAGDRFKFVQVRHEETAGFLACGHVKYGAGPIGVCLATSGPGAIHMLNGLYDAKLDGQPVLALVGQQPRTALGGAYYQEVDLVSLYKDVAGAFVEQASHPAQIRHLVDRAIRIALAERTVTALILPNDLQEAEAVTDAPAEHARLRLVGRLLGAGHRPGPGRPRACRRGAQQRRSRRDAGRTRRDRRDRGGHRGRRRPRRRRGQGAARAHRARRRAAVGDRPDRAARLQAELGPHAGLRHAAHGRGRTCPTASSCRPTARRAACRSTSTASASGSATRPRST